MNNRKAPEPLPRQPKTLNSSTEFVNYQLPTLTKIRKLSRTNIGKCPVYGFIIEHNNQYCPLRYMLDLGSTSFVSSPEAAKVFSILLVKWEKLNKCHGISGTNLKNEGLVEVPLAISFGNHHSYNKSVHVLEVG
jgi:hypothetical protein